MSDNLTPSFVRTLVPIVVGALASRFAVDSTDPTVTLVVSSVISYVYYVVVRFLELKAPQLGYLLGVAKAPAYSVKPAPSPGTGENVEAVVVPEV